MAEELGCSCFRSQFSADFGKSSHVCWVTTAIATTIPTAALAAAPVRREVHRSKLDSNSSDGRITGLVDSWIKTWTPMHSSSRIAILSNAYTLKYILKSTCRIIISSVFRIQYTLYTSMFGREQSRDVARLMLQKIVTRLQKKIQQSYKAQ